MRGVCRRDATGRRGGTPPRCVRQKATARRQNPRAGPRQSPGPPPPMAGLAAVTSRAPRQRAPRARRQGGRRLVGTAVPAPDESGDRSACRGLPAPERRGRGLYTSSGTAPRASGRADRGKTGRREGGGDRDRPAPVGPRAPDHQAAATHDPDRQLSGERVRHGVRLVGTQHAEPCPPTAAVRGRTTRRQ